MLARIRYLFASLLLVALLAPAAHAQHGHGSNAQGHGGGFHTRLPGPEAIEVPAPGLTLPMQDFGGRPVVEVKINGRGPFRFILDTGASANVIDAALNDELNLPVAEGFQAASPSGRPGPALVSIREIRLGDAAIRGAIGAVMPLSGMLGADGPRGVLSAANFPGYLLTFDFPARRISLQKGKLDNPDSETIFEYSAADLLPTVPVSIAGRKTRVHLDTGSPAGLTLPTKFLKELPLASEPRKPGRAKGHTGDFPISKASIQGEIALGKHKLALAEVEFSDVVPGRSAATTGLIGYQVLRNFVVTLDTRSRRIRFTQSGAPPA